MLHDPTRHEPLRHLAWDESRAREAIRRIVRDTEQCFVEHGHWPLHPRDIEPGDDPSQPATPLYHGAIGVLYASNGAIPRRWEYDFRIVARGPGNLPAV